VSSSQVFWSERRVRNLVMSGNSNEKSDVSLLAMHVNQRWCALLIQKYDSEGIKHLYEIA
jgi:hypothetical protein